MLGYSETWWAREGGSVECGAQHGQCVVEYSESFGGAKQVSCRRVLAWLAVRLM